MSLMSKHPVLIFGLGLVAGFYAHKYRREIIESAMALTEKGQDFVKQQAENLEDIVATKHH